jgi:Zn-dependent protease with chaperone function
LLTSVEIRSAFTAPPAPLPVTWGYRLRLAGIVAGLATLLLLYLALIGALALFAGYWLLFGTIFAAYGLLLFLWLTPPAAAVVVILGLTRPLVRRRPEAPKPISISAQDEPVLFEFVDRLSSILNVPRPAEICVDLSVNANAGVVGWKGLLTGRLRLTIGLPLAAAFSLPQMAGILAHELGHFSQGVGLRSYFVISKTREWLLRVAQERDSWDTWIEQHRRRGKWMLMALANLAWLGLTISRRYLAALARAAQWMTAAFSRHMEFDADRHEAAIVGAAIFEETTTRLPQLRAASELTWRDVFEGWAIKRAPEDVPGTVIAVEQILTEATVERVRKEASARRTLRWDTHPCDVERIEAARAFDAPPLFALPGEGRLLFADLPALSRRATVYHYEKIVRMACTGMRLVTAEECIGRIQAKSAGIAAVHQLFHCSPAFVAAWIQFPVRDPTAGESAGGECTLDGAQEEMAYLATAEKARLHFCARTIRDAGVKVNVNSFQLREDGVGAVRSEHAASAGRLAVTMAALNRAAKPAIAEVERSVSLIWDHDPTVFVFENGAFFSGEIRDLWRLAGVFSESLEDIQQLRWKFSALDLVRLNLRLFPLANSANLLEDLATEAEELMKRIHARIGGVVLESGEPTSTHSEIQSLLQREWKSGKEESESIVRNIEAIRVQVLIRLAHFATAYRVEKSAGTSMQAASLPPSSSGV